MDSVRREVSLRAGLTMLVLVLGSLLGFRVWGLLGESWRERAALAPKPISIAGALPAEEQQTVQLFENAVPSVVYVRTLAKTSSPWFEEPRLGVVGGAAGFVWESNYVVTSHHVVSDVLVDQTGRRRLIVQLRDGRWGEARIIGVEADADVAVLKVDLDPKLLRPIPLASSKQLRVGQRAYAIGNPYGREYTLTGGLISALDREIEPFDRRISGVIQTDAAINPGNSGGPLLDSSGRLIGMVVAMSGQARNLGFAIPSDTLNAVVPELIRYGRVQKPGLGVSFANDVYSASFRRGVGIAHGLRVLNVQKGSSAEQAGVLGGDVLARLDGVHIDDQEGYLAAVNRKKIGDAVTLDLLRDGKELHLDATLQERRPF